MRAYLIALVAVPLLISGCATDTYQPTSTAYPPHTSAYPPHTRPVFVTKGTLPADQFVAIADLEESKGWYGSTDNTQQALADRARALGADAVLNMRSWHAPSAGAWASPYSSGKAVKLHGDPKRVLDGLIGDWR